MKKIHWFCSVAMLLVATACSKNDDVDTSLLKVEAPMAEFASVTEFEATVLRLMKSSLEEQIAWCQENNIVSQCMLYDQAIDELEKIQELRDTTEYYHAIDDFKEKYSPYFLFSRPLKDALLLNSQQINVRFPLRCLQVFVPLRLKTCRLYDKQDQSPALIVQFVGRPTEPQTSLVSARRQDRLAAF